MRARLERQEGGHRGAAMSGGVFQNPAYGEGGEEPGVNPLVCYLCHQVPTPTTHPLGGLTMAGVQTYREPCLLACYHTFCAWCLRGRAQDAKLACPICG